MVSESPQRQTRAEISEYVLAHWALFEGIGWKRPASTVDYYFKRQDKFQEDLVAIRHAAERQVVSPIVQDRRTNPLVIQTEQALQAIRNLGNLGYMPEQIQGMVACPWVTSQDDKETQFSIESIVHVLNGKPTRVHKFLGIFPKTM